ncbi:SMP-30/gluconolactonase/LRE family protein [Treponema ruminis]|uniref:Gluconolactonase n=1 Tax=Treponema ruminis TaxID=744515 RepID=A0A7W8GAP3_9SPIR|nr:SMP-30/gluconolactonase/LRE family protein [Treponema ruminis]MBB5226776.1 gluconolactonase [Treponema ruminis]QSI02001.1 SMP-30/gluconolactonase/LRE family protein [Treponema ruminis]
MKTYTAEVYSTEKYQLGESPFYDSRTKTLSWVDISKGRLFTQGPDGVKKSFTFDKPIGAAVPSEKEGSYLVAGSDGIYLLDGEKASLIKNLSEYYEAYQRSNDAKADPAGRLWFGSSVNDDNHQASGNLFCLDKGKVSCKQADTKISNGMAWSSDRKKFYFSDSLQYAVFSYDYDLATGEISNRKVLFKVENGVSDGMCIDSEDNLWVAIWGGRRIECRSSKDGSLLARVNVDAQNVTSCCFMGDNLDTLFITTSGQGQTGEHDGCLFTCKLDTKGCQCDYVKA